MLDKYLAAYIYQLIFTAKDLLNTPAVFCLPLFPSFYFPPSIIILFVPTPPGVFLRWPGREETNLNRNGPAGSSMELRVFVRKLFVCRVRALQFCVRNLGDHVRREKRKEREKEKPGGTIVVTIAITEEISCCRSMPLARFTLCRNF